MGKASRWFRGLLGLNKPDPNPNQPQKNIQKKKWSFTKSNKERYRYNPQHCEGVDHGGEVNRHAMEVAAATTKVAEASVATGLAVQHTGRINNSNSSTTACVSQSRACYQRGREELAAVTMIQAHFRAYLSRRALRALKALVRLQALVRGHLTRKRTADALRQLQALVRAQTRTRVGRVLNNSESPNSTFKSSHFNHPGPETPEKFENVIRARRMNHEHSTILKRNGSKSNGNVNYEVDTGKLHVNPRRRNLFQSYHRSLNSDQNCQSLSTTKDSAARKTGLSPSPGEVRSLSPFKFVEDVDESDFLTADNSPQYYSASSMACSSKKEAFTPTKSEGSRTCLSGYSDYKPSYMAYTESSKAKVRSLSAPKQRPQYEKSSSTKRYSVHGYGDSRSTNRVSALQNNFTNKVYPGSGRLDRLEMPARRDVTGFSGSHWLRY